MPVRVLMFGWELPPFNSGGLGTACYGLSKSLSESGVEITFVLPKDLGVKADFMQVVSAGLENFDWTKYSTYFSVFGTQSGSGDLGNMPPDLVAAVRAYAEASTAIAKKYPHDIIHAHDWLCYPAGLVAGQVSGRPLVSHVHATEYDRSGGLGANPVVYGYERNGMDGANSIIAVSNFTKNLLQEKYAQPGTKINVVHNGINPDEWHPHPVLDKQFQSLKDAGYKIVLYAGRLTLQKGVDYFIKAAKTVLHFHPDTIFLVVGSGDQERQLIDMVAHMGISNRVLFAGFLRGSLLRSAFQAADIFVMPSVSEPFGIMALESVALGTPALVSRQSGVSETLTHVLKADFWDTDEMANQILSVVAHGSLHHSLKVNGQTQGRQQTWTKAAQKTKAIYEQTLASAK